MRIMAIDPGLNASAAFYNPGSSSKSGLRWQFIDVPLVDATQGRRPDVRALRDWMMRLHPDRAFMEFVGGMPHDGKASLGIFMRATGHLEACIDCCDVPMTRVTPQRWKKFHQIPTGSDKEISRQFALKLHPELAPWLTRKKDHGRAEAALLALYGAHCMAPISPV